MDQERRCADAAAQLLHHKGLDYRPAVMILFVMAWDGMTYGQALAAWSEYEFNGGWAPERWHSEICYRFIKAGIDGHPEQMFEKWKREICHED